MRDRLLLIGAVLAAFGASLGSGFHLDDDGIFSGFDRARPLTSLTFWLNNQIGGQDALGYHALNLLLHLGAVLLAFECLKRMMPQRAAFVAAAIFAVHPLQAEAVNYVSARGILLVTLLCLAGLSFWLRGQKWVAVFWFAAALAVDFGIAAVFTAPSIRTGGVMIWRYLRLLAIPDGFTIDPDIRVPPVWLAVAAWAAVASLAWLAWKREWTWLLGGLILRFPAALLPSAEPAADHRAYFAMFAFAAAAGLLLVRGVGAQLAAPALLPVLVIATLTLLSFNR